MTREERIKKQAAARHRAYRRTLNGRLSRAAERANKLAADYNLEGRVVTGELKLLYEQQGGLCVLTGRSLTCDRPNSSSHMSLDHIVAINCPSGVSIGKVSNMCLVRLPVNKAKNNRPLCELFNESVPILTQYMVDTLTKDRQKEIVELQYEQLKELGKDVVKGEFIVVKNYRRKHNNRRSK